MRALLSIGVLLVALLCLAGHVLAAPWLVCDPQQGVSAYRLTGPAWVPAIVAAQADTSLKLDISGAGDGFNLVTVEACRDAGALDCSAAASVLIGAQSGKFAFQGGTVVYREHWIPGRLEPSGTGPGK